jgi:hypothetical protein
MFNDEKEAIRLARSLIRDMAHGWPVRELAETPEEVCRRLSAILREKYDFAHGNVTEESP